MMDQTWFPNTTVSPVEPCTCLAAQCTVLACATVTDFPMYQIHWGREKRRQMVDLASDLQKLVWPPNLDKIFLLLFVVNK